MFAISSSYERPFHIPPRLLKMRAFVLPGDTQHHAQVTSQPYCGAREAISGRNKRLLSEAPRSVWYGRACSSHITMKVHTELPQNLTSAYQGVRKLRKFFHPQENAFPTHQGPLHQSRPFGG